MLPLIIRSPHLYRELSWHQLPKRVQEEFDYIQDTENASFVKYNGEYYDLHDLEPSNVMGWDLQHVDTFFSAVLFRQVEGGWRCATIYS